MTRPFPTLPTLVEGCAGSSYDCPDLAAVDYHLQHLRRRLDEPGAVARYVRRDIDRLLDYRALYLQVNGGVA